MSSDGYEHFGLLLRSPDDVDEVWATLSRECPEVHLEPLDRRDNGYRGFRLRHLLPFTVEVQFIPDR